MLFPASKDIDINSKNNLDNIEKETTYKTYFFPKPSGKDYSHKVTVKEEKYKSGNKMIEDILGIETAFELAKKSGNTLDFGHNYKPKYYDLHKFQETIKR
jgi:hypothetical protein